jgi:hypothetical protein
MFKYKKDFRGINSAREQDGKYWTFVANMIIYGSLISGIIYLLLK